MHTKWDIGIVISDEIRSIYIILDSSFLGAYRMDCGHIDLDSMFQLLRDVFSSVTNLAYFGDIEDIIINY